MDNIVQLKLIDETYVTEKYVNWINNSEVNKHLETHKTTLQDLLKYVKNKMNNNNCLMYVILYNNIHVGNIKIEPIDYNTKECVLGIMIGDKNYHRKGIGTKSILLIIDVLKEKNIKNIYLGVKKDNIPAISLYKKIGFYIIEEENHLIKKHNDAYLMRYDLR